MKKIFVSGACGYVGTLLVPKLIESGYNVVAMDTLWFGNMLAEHDNLKLIHADIRDIDAITMEGVDAVIHLANIANDPCGDLNSKLVWEVNVLATKLLIEKAIECGVEYFVYASSGSVYGIKEEQQVTEDLSLVPISDYNKTKMISERVLLSYQDQIRLCIIRPATVCGYSPRMRLDLSVNMLTMQALNKGNITVFGGTQVRPNIHIKDMVSVYMHFLEGKSLKGAIFNAGFENLSLLEIAERITQHIPAEIVITDTHDPRSYRLNSDRLQSAGFSPKYSVDDAIVEIKQKFEQGLLQDEDRYYNIKVMQGLGLGQLSDKQALHV